MSKKLNSLRQKHASSSSRLVPCARNRGEMKKLDKEGQDCFVLDFDPSHHSSSKIPVSNNNADADLLLLAHKGEVACRDFPHPRHNCGRFPFRTTPKDRHCKQCYCYVCDVPAPCEVWSNHCFAFDDAAWNSMRKSTREANKLQKQEARRPHWRHECDKFPFMTTNRTTNRTSRRCCEQCYCYVCEVPAPCEKWVGRGIYSHRHAHENGKWRFERELKRQAKNKRGQATQQTVRNPIPLQGRRPEQVIYNSGDSSVEGMIL